MTEDTTGNKLTPEQVAAQEQEQKNHNQEQAAKRLSEDNKALKLELQALKEGKTEKTTVKSETAGVPDLADLIRKELGAQKEIDASIAEVLTEFPELKEHESKIREYITDDSRKNIPIEEVIAGAVGVKGLMKIGAGMNAERLQSAQETANGGGDAKIEIKTEEQKQEDKWNASLPDGFKS